MAALALVLASHNAKKLAELRALLGHLPVALRSSGELGIDEPEEPHATFLENALAKARHVARATGGAALADDSGLTVAALGGAPGVGSAHYAALPDLDPPAGGSPAGAEPAPHDTPHDTPRERQRRRQDAANNARLLAELGALGPAAPRDAAFVCTLVAIRHAEDPEPLVAVGRWTGRILEAPQGAAGFGYDPLMFIPALGRTVAELEAAVKNRESHRARAVAVLAERLRTDWQLG